MISKVTPNIFIPNDVELDFNELSGIYSSHDAPKV